LVDDSLISKKLSQKIILGSGLEMGYAENGQDALELLRRCPNDFDLIICDIVMPIMDGIELVTTIKQEDQLKDIPVVMLSGLSDQMLSQVCIESGAEQVITKPLAPHVLRGILTKLKIS